MSIVHISKYIEKNRIQFLDSMNKKEVLRSLCDASENQLGDKELFLRKIYDREEIMSTGLGFGIAFPHVKIPSVSEFFITVGICKSGVDWNAFDGNPVEIIFLIGGPDGQQNRYLGILSKLSLIVKNVNNRNKLLSSNTPEDVIHILGKF
jgi:mannitol/fructose-specific phosphotransferase system IIA component (Ntr-type)